MHSCWDLLANQPTACVSHLHPSIFVSSRSNDNLLAGLCLIVSRKVFLRSCGVPFCCDVSASLRNRDVHFWRRRKKAQLQNLTVASSNICHEHRHSPENTRKNQSIQNKNEWPNGRRWVRIGKKNWLKILSGPEETEFLLFPVAIVHFQVLAGITTWFLLVLFYLGFGYFLSVFIWNHNMILFQFKSWNQMFSLLSEFPPEENIFQNSLAFTSQKR